MRSTWTFARLIQLASFIPMCVRTDLHCNRKTRWPDSRIMLKALAFSRFSHLPLRLLAMPSPLRATFKSTSIIMQTNCHHKRCVQMALAFNRTLCHVDNIHFVINRVRRHFNHILCFCSSFRLFACLRVRNAFNNEWVSQRDARVCVKIGNRHSLVHTEIVVDRIFLAICFWSLVLRQFY